MRLVEYHLDRCEMSGIWPQVSRAYRCAQASVKMLGKKFRGRVDSGEFRNFVKVPVVIPLQDRCQGLSGLTDIDDDIVRIERLTSKLDINDEGRTVQCLGRAKDRSTKTVRNHDVVSNRKRIHAGAPTGV